MKKFTSTLSHGDRGAIIKHKHTLAFQSYIKWEEKNKRKQKVRNTYESHNQGIQVHLKIKKYLEEKL